MNIDYSIPERQRYFHYLYSNFNFGAKHIGLACAMSYDLPIAERIKHFILGIFECMPFIGHVIAAIDRKMTHINARVILLNQKTAFDRGYAHGRKLRKEIRSLYKFIKKQIKQLDFKENLFSILEKGLNDFECTEKISVSKENNSKHSVTITIILKEGYSFTSDKISKFSELFKCTFPYYKIEHLQQSNSVQYFLIKNSIDPEKLSADERAEMRGIAKGAGVSYEDVVNVNTFLDRFPGICACSALATIVDNVSVKRFATTNDFVSKGENGERLEKLNKFQIDSTISAQKRALHEVSKEDSIQSIIFDVNNKTFYLSTSNNNSAEKTYTTFSNIFDNKSDEKNEGKKITLSRNLDWSWPIAPQTIVLVKEGVASVTWPGFIGCLSAINKHGLSMATCSAGNEVNEQGNSVPLLLHKMLKEAKSVKEAIEILKESSPAISINITLAGPDGIARVELDPGRQKKGVVHFEFEEI